MTRAPLAVFAPYYITLLEINLIDAELFAQPHHLGKLVNIERHHDKIDENVRDAVEAVFYYESFCIM